MCGYIRYRLNYFTIHVLQPCLCQWTVLPDCMHMSFIVIAAMVYDTVTYGDDKKAVALVMLGFQV